MAKKLREKGFFCFWLFWYQQVIFSLMALTDIYTFVIMTALRTSQRKGEISKGGRGGEVNLSQKELAETWSNARFGCNIYSRDTKVANTLANYLATLASSVSRPAVTSERSCQHGHNQTKGRVLVSARHSTGIVKCICLVQFCKHHRRQ